MLQFVKLIPALAVIVSLSPLAANALSQHGSQKAYIAATSVSSQVAANSKGRPAEFTPASSNEVAVNSKGRPGEFQVADNSKGRPGENAAPQYETPMG
jgi:hypothetical protein